MDLQEAATHSYSDGQQPAFVLKDTAETKLFIGGDLGKDAYSSGDRRCLAVNLAPTNSFSGVW